MSVNKIISFYSQALQLRLVHFAELFNVAEAVVADGQVSQVWKELNTVECGQAVVTQKELLNFRKLLDKCLVLRLRLWPIELEGRDVLVVEGQFVASDH